MAGGQNVHEMKSRQMRKIEELRIALKTDAASFRAQAKLLGLPRSTTWALLHRSYKNYGLTASIIERLLASETLPRQARQLLFEYVEEKSNGDYGHARCMQKNSGQVLNAAPGARVSAMGGRSIDEEPSTRRAD